MFLLARSSRPPAHIRRIGPAQRRERKSTFSKMRNSEWTTCSAHCPLLFLVYSAPELCAK